jgi:hypothetical protein
MQSHASRFESYTIYIVHEYDNNDVQLVHGYCL